MPGKPTLESSSNRLYEAALGVQSWKAALDGVRNHFNAVDCHVLVYDERQATVVAQRSVTQPEVVDYWLEEWAASGRCPRFRHGLSNPDPIGWDFQFTDHRSMQHSHYYRELAPRGAAFYLAMRTRDSRGDAGGLSCALALNFDKDQGHVEANKIRAARLFLPHFERATRIALASRGQAASAVTAVADATGQGAITTDGSARVLSVNGRAELLLSRGDGPILKEGRLTARRHADTRTLHALIASAVESTGAVRGGDLCLSGDDGMPRYAVTVAPLPCTSDMFPSLGARVILFITPLRHEKAPDAARLQRLHGLTRQEARVAAQFLTGQGLPEIADTLGLSVRGVRFHLNNCYRKLGVSGQAALVRLLSLSLHSRQ